MAPRGNTEWPKEPRGPRWHRTGSPTMAVLDEKLGSSSVHCNSVPAGMMSRVAADAATATTRTRVRSRDFRGIDETPCGQTSKEHTPYPGTLDRQSIARISQAGGIW